ncbi:MAG TPA: S8 family peptidase, partial [Thermoguttaceae bacterium]|nr:S8 family peptidase [Thermoguttaceae bacterium]
VELVKCDSIMFFRPVGQMATDKSPVEVDLAELEVPEAQERPSGDPIVAVLDGFPLANHALLADRLVIDDPDDFASQYTVADRVHGTAMSSLVVHGDLSSAEKPLARPVYVRPIMKPIDEVDSHHEYIPADVIVVDLIHLAVRRMFEDDGAAAPNIRIINLSIGDPSRQFTQIMSPLARLLDWLSVKYRVLFVVSAGNHAQREVDTGVSSSEFNGSSQTEKEACIVKSLYADARHRRLLSPAESINGITVGSLHHDSATVGHLGRAINLFEYKLPSPLSAFGSGYRRALKPDLIFDGGRILHTETFGTTTEAKFGVLPRRSAPGNRVASPSQDAGDLSKVAYSCGTSNSAALVSRALCICHDSLLEIFNEQAPDIEFTTYVAPLLKAMIVHGCSWGDVGARLRQILQNPDNGQQIRNWISRWLGYGVPDYAKVLDCTEQRVSILGFGQLNDGEAHVFSLPLPPSLAARRDRRRLTVTLAYLSPVASNTQLYRIANLWFEVEGVALASDRQDAEWRTVRRGTVQHEVFENDRAVPFSDGDTVTIKVNCRKDAGRIDDPVIYGLVVSLEVAEGIDVPIYDEVRTRIATAIEIRARQGQ